MTTDSAYPRASTTSATAVLLSFNVIMVHSTNMASTTDKDRLERTASQISTASRKSGTVKVRSRKTSLVPPNSAKTLESFPSLSPENSPSAKRATLVVSPPPHSASGGDDLDTLNRDSVTVQSLLRNIPSARDRAALFDDSTKSEENELPGALHRASDEHIRRVIKKTGSVALVKQLAEDLAERDAEMTLFRRRAEERERELKKMLKEVEVSNLDIETRLRRLDRSEDYVSDGVSSKQKDAGIPTNNRLSKPTNDLGELMDEAMNNRVGALSIDENYVDSLGNGDGQATLRAQNIKYKEPGRQSTESSMESSSRNRGTIRGWRDYLWNGNGTSRKTSKASSMISDFENQIDVSSKTQVLGDSSNVCRKGLDEDLFRPLARASTTDDGLQSVQSGKSSTSIASWTMKLFAGNPTTIRESDRQGTVRSRSNTTGTEPTKGSRSGSAASGVPPRSAKAALMRVSSIENTRQQKKAAQALPLGQKRPSKSSIPPVPPLPNNPARVQPAQNLGPVEMDTIHPPDSKPPTLLQKTDNKSTNLLTDSFGFIYDQRRRKLEAEAIINHKRGKSNVSANIQMINSARASTKSPEPDRVSQLSNSNSHPRPDTPVSNEELIDDKPTKGWQDYLKIATFPTELLSHTPSVKPGTNVVSPTAPSPTLRRMPTTADARASLPSLSTNLEPEMSPVTASNAEISKASLKTSDTQLSPTIVDTEPVKLLLSQLTELHDNLQREKTVKWNEFLRKVRAERKKEGEAAATTGGRFLQAAMPEMMLTDGEVIGVAGLGNKGKVGRAKWKELKQLVLGGIPVAYRAKIWAECSGASALRVPGYYDDLVASGIDDPTVLSQIQMDIHRTLTDNVFFRDGPGVAKLNEVLLAYSRRNSEVGYCQGMNLIAGSLLLIMPTAEDAFWVLTSLIENILPQHYYDPSLLASRADQQVLREYVAELLPKLWAHLVELGIEPEALTFQWFLSIFTDCLSAEALFRVWDVIFCFNDGSTFLFQVALALLKLNETQLLECDTTAKIYGYIGNEMTDHAISIDGLINASDALKNVVRRKEVEERRWRAIEDAKAREKRGRGSVSASSAGSVAELSMQEPRPFEGGESGKE